MGIDLLDEEGVCNACRSHENRKTIDWKKRKEELSKILDRYRSQDGPKNERIF